MGRAMVARLGLGLLLLALLLPTQIYCNQTSVAPFSGNQNISASPNPSNATTRGGGSSLQSTAGLLALSSTSLLLETQARKRLYFPIFYTYPKWQPQVQCDQEETGPPRIVCYHTSTENTENSKFDGIKGRVKGLREERCRY
ncbi:mCG140796 [Mus musculus]|jgi:CD24 antigen|uniref:HSA-C protein n=1 Tax=Mus musculus TaxID=10090 RepID=Q61692_MOUSE|nr:mCG140796 [Mus musculus]CAA39843.1 HSA-C [Mus musculus]